MPGFCWVFLIFLGEHRDLQPGSSIPASHPSIRGPGWPRPCQRPRDALDWDAGRGEGCCYLCYHLAFGGKSLVLKDLGSV